MTRGVESVLGEPATGTRTRSISWRICHVSYALSMVSSQLLSRGHGTTPASQKNSRSLPPGFPCPAPSQLLQHCSGFLGTPSALSSAGCEPHLIQPQRHASKGFPASALTTSYKKGHKYITVVINHDTGKVIWAHEGHGKTIFAKFFKLLNKEQRTKIQLVSGDGARWIQECINEFCSEAKRCIDPFHVVQWATQALDAVRRTAWHDARKSTKDMPPKRCGRPAKGSPKADTGAGDLKGSRFALGKAPENLTKKQQAQLAFIAKADRRLYRAYLLKEKLRLVFQCEDAAAAKKELDGWIKWAQHCRLNVFVELQRKIRRHYDAILATIEHHLSNAVLEATNRKIKLSVYMAYGFRNIDNMLDMIMLRCSDIDVRLPWEYEAA